MIYSSNPFSNHMKWSKNGIVLCTPGKTYGRVQVELHAFLRTYEMMASSQFLPSAALCQWKYLRCSQNWSLIGLQNWSGHGETGTLFFLRGIERKPLDFIVYSPAVLSKLFQTLVATLCHLIISVCNIFLTQTSINRLFYVMYEPKNEKIINKYWVINNNRFCDSEVLRKLLNSYWCVFRLNVPSLWLVHGRDRTITWFFFAKSFSDIVPYVACTFLESLF